MRSPTGSTADEHERRPRDHPRRRRHCRVGACADRDPPAADEDLRRPRDARLGARERRGRASAPAPAGRHRDQRPVRHHPRRPAGDRPQGRDRRRAEAAMTGVWIGAAILLVVVLPIVVVLLKGVLDAARSIVPAIDSIAATAEAGSKDLDAAALLLTTREQVKETIAGVAAYGGSLDVILDDAEAA